jgi:hypothetical protein
MYFNVQYKALLEHTGQQGRTPDKHSAISSSTDTPTPAHTYYRVHNELRRKCDNRFRHVIDLTAKRIFAKSDTGEFY